MLDDNVSPVADQPGFRATGQPLVTFVYTCFKNSKCEMTHPTSQDSRLYAFLLYLLPASNHQFVRLFPQFVLAQSANHALAEALEILKCST
eukprot:307907-Pelagomonas_calceolata.AAC.1